MEEFFLVYVEPLLIYFISLEVASLVISVRSGERLPAMDIKSVQALVYTIALPFFMGLYIIKILTYLFTGTILFFL